MRGLRRVRRMRRGGHRARLPGFEAHRPSVQRGAQVFVRRVGQELPGSAREVQRGDDGNAGFQVVHREPGVYQHRPVRPHVPRVQVGSRATHVRRHGRYERQHADEAAERRVQDDPLHPRVAEAGGMGDVGARPVHDGRRHRALLHAVHHHGHHRQLIEAHPSENAVEVVPQQRAEVPRDCGRNQHGPVRGWRQDRRGD